MKLKRSTDRKAETATFARQEQTRQFISESEFCSGVVKINQAERDIDDRNLHAKLDTDARTKLAEFTKRRFVNANHVVALSFAAQENLLNARRQADRTAKTVAATEDINKLSFGYDLIIEKQETSETAFQIRRVSES